MISQETLSPLRTSHWRNFESYQRLVVYRQCPEIAMQSACIVCFVLGRWGFEIGRAESGTNLGMPALAFSRVVGLRSLRFATFNALPLLRGSPICLARSVSHILISFSLDSRNPTRNQLRS